MPASTEHQKACPGRLLQWPHKVQAAFAHLSKPQVWGLVRMSARGSRCQEQQGLHKSVLSLRWCWTNKNKRCFNVCASGIWMRSTKASRAGCDLLFCSPITVDRASVGKREPRDGVGPGCTTLSDRWTILSISVVIRSCAIPVAWKVLGRQKIRQLATALGRTPQESFGQYSR